MNIFHIPAYTDNYIWVLQSGADISVIDPGEASPILNLINNNNLNLVDILLTHHHFDHIGGTLELKKQIKGKVYGPVGNIEGIDIHVSENDKVETLGYDFSVLETPGHTLDHIAYVDNEKNLVFCGDTLFSAGCGRVFEGTFEQMHNSIQKLNQLVPETIIYCAHEYTESNLKFVLSEIEDKFIENYFKKISAKRLKGDISIPTTLELERRINPFLLSIVPSDLKHLSKLEQFTELRNRKDSA
ncbi:MAG: hydroxyacylglutathione hydrolase [Gammaproteobacteria bacterium TMED112]|nr:MAG: hydroxyacylglutathione hydrolase [Gammaproteobacteria bacterium TMED112]|tara:strand:+ start:4096 stop:4824 length:729 start_codon:yes stop_codon:yes gene_type:complete